MNIAVIAAPDSFSEISKMSNEINWIHTSFSELNRFDFSAIFNLNENSSEEDYSHIQTPIFINSVVHTLAEKKLPTNVIRINGWFGFLERPIWEMAGVVSEQHEMILKKINKKYIAVADEPGFVAARILAMIINEAYFAKAENVSSTDDIDIAMKLGTNYPLGPFEWKNKIGAKNISMLLKKLSHFDKRYSPSSLLTAEADLS